MKSTPQTLSIKVPSSVKTTDDNGVEIVGLNKVTMGARHHFWQSPPRIYQYQMSDGCTMSMLSPIKGVKDLRAYAEKHPKRQAFIDWCQRWQPVPQFFSSTAQAGAYTTAPTWFKPVKR